MNEEEKVFFEYFIKTLKKQIEEDKFWNVNHSYSPTGVVFFDELKKVYPQWNKKNFLKLIDKFTSLKVLTIIKNGKIIILMFCDFFYFLKRYHIEILDYTERKFKYWQKKYLGNVPPCLN